MERPPAVFGHPMCHEDESDGRSGLGPPPGREPGSVEVYWRPGCMFCFWLRRGLERRGIAVEEHNIWDEPVAAAFVRSVAGGNETVPTVVVGERFMVNPTASQVEQLLAEVAPETLECSRERAAKRGGRIRRLMPGG